jgi:Bacterial TSP3 repeat
MTTPNQPLDTDRDGIPDWLEIQLGTNPFSNDTDNDGVRDGDEIHQGTNPLLPDQTSVTDFAMQIGTFVGAHYAFTVEPQDNSVFIMALDEQRPGIDGQGLIYADRNGEIQSQLRQQDLDNFAQVQQHLIQSRQSASPSEIQFDR